MTATSSRSLIALVAALATQEPAAHPSPWTGTAPEPAFRPAAPGYAWSFPRDHWSHPGYRTEWWYFTGTLASVEPPGRELGYQLTFFRVGLLPEAPPLASPWTTANLVMVHAA